MSELRDDLAAFVPRARRRIRFQDREYGVRALLDLTVSEVLEILYAETDRGQTQAADLAAAARQVELLIPEMDGATRHGLTLRQLSQIADAAREASEDSSSKASSLRLGFFFARAARFYGWTWESIERLTLRRLIRFVHYISELRARERLDESLVALFPHMNDSARWKLGQEWLEAAGLLGDVPGLPRVPWDQVRVLIGAKGHA